MTYYAALLTDQALQEQEAAEATENAHDLTPEELARTIPSLSMRRRRLTRSRG